MIINITKTILTALIGFLVSSFNIVAFAQNCSEIANGTIGIVVGILTIIFLYYQIKKTKKDLKNESRNKTNKKANP